MTEMNYIPVCKLEDIAPNTGVCALVAGEQVALFRIGNTEEVYAIGNYDPIGEANVLSRGMSADLKGELYVASPLYKHHYHLKTGVCLEDSTQSVPVYPVVVSQNQIKVATRLKSVA